MKLIQLVYVSSATVPFEKPELFELLAISRANNAKVDVTGLLLFKGGNFLQTLEGDEQVVNSLFVRVSKDPRHNGILTLLKNSIEKREFQDWSMAFRDLSDVDLAAFPGYSEFLNVTLTDQSLTKNPSKVNRLLSVFRTSMR